MTLVIALGFILAAAAAVRIWLGAKYYIEYDGYLHIFISRQHDWRTLFREINTTAHPPLFFLLLRVPQYFARSFLAYRSVFILSGILSILPFFLIARRVYRHDSSVILACVAWALSFPSILISLEVRGYMPAMLFLLISYAGVIAISIQRETSLNGAWTFAVAGSLAVITEYAAILVLAACIGALVIPVLAARDLGTALQDRWKQYGRLVVASLLPVMIFGVLYGVHARSWAKPLSHLPQYYYSTSGLSLFSYLWQGTGELTRSFTPVGVGSAALGVTLFLASLLTVVRASRGGSRARGPALVVLRTFVLLASLLCVLGVLGKYPFGGSMRQQFFLFPFAVLTVFVFVDAALDTLQAGWGRQLLVIITVVALVIHLTLPWRGFKLTAWNSPERALADFHRAFPMVGNTARPDRLVWVDQFNIIRFFMGYHTWVWREAEATFTKPHLRTYRITDGKRTVRVVRDTSRWNFEFGEARLYQDMASTMRELGAAKVTVFAVSQFGDRPTGSETFVTTVKESARNAGLRVERLIVDKGDVFATFVPAPGAGQP